jgi:hypothetical protein
MALKNHDGRSISLVASNRSGRYSRSVIANSMTGIGVPTRRRTHRHKSGFFVSKTSAYLYGWAVWGFFGSTGTYVRHANLHGSSHHDWRHGGGRTYRNIGASPMTTRHLLTLNPTKARAAFHRACAMAALHADSSLSVRLKRYNESMAKARALEAQGGVQ